MRKIVIASDSFKGSLSSLQVAQSVAKGLEISCPDSQIVMVNVADGGEGTIDAIIDSLNGTRINIKARDPLSRPIDAYYGIAAHTAIIEMSQASGITLLSQSERNPLLTSTHGTGDIILDALHRGCTRFLIGIGGSATNDAGTGMLQSLGFRFIDHNGCVIPHCNGSSLSLIASIDDSHVHPALKQASFSIACDVDTPFCGIDGAAHIFAPQKGADSAMVEALDCGMYSFAKVISQKYNIDIIPIAGAGAAGGLGGAFKAFLNAQLMPGIDMVLDTLQFDHIIDQASLIITGEGHIDHQTPKGKTPAGVLRRGRAQNIPVIAIGGRVDMCDEVLQMGFADIFPVTPPHTPLHIAMQPHFASEAIISLFSSGIIDCKKYFS